MRTTTLFVTCLLLLGQLCLGTMVSQGQTSTPGSSRQVYSAEQAHSLAQAWIERKHERFPAWQGAQAAEPLLYYDLDAQPIAYVVSVYQNEQDVGHIILSYEVTAEPVLVFGAGVAPHKRCPECSAPETLAAQGWQLAEHGLIYAAPLDFFFRLEPQQPVTAQAAADSATVWLLPMGGQQPLQVAHTSTATLQSADQVLEGIPQLPQAEAGASANVRQIFGVPDFNQFLMASCYSGCTPTSAGNIMHFWSQAGYPQLARSPWYDTVTALRSSMHTFCKGLGGATFTSDASPGMVNYARGSGYRFKSKFTCSTGNDLDCEGVTNWSQYTAQIDQSHPVLLSLDSKFYGSHSVTGVGYDVDGSKYWIVHDNWPTTYTDVSVLTSSASWHSYHTFVPPSEDTTAPTAQTSLPRFLRQNTPITVSWSGADNFSGVARYDVQYFDPLTADWRDWHRSTTLSSGSLSGRSSGTVQVRSRSYDWMGNQSDWSLAEGRIYASALSGVVTGNRGGALARTIPVSSTQALDPAYPDAFGRFRLYLSSATTVTLTLGNLPAMQQTVNNQDLSGVQLVLPPSQELLLNGQFEQGLQAWNSSGTLATSQSDTGHTGQSAAQIVIPAGTLNASAVLSQTIATPVSVSRPTLSWFSQLSGSSLPDGQLLVKVEGSAGTVISSTLPLRPGGWSHHWLALDSLVGQRITVSFELQSGNAPQAATLLLDEISLGEGQAEARSVAVPRVANGR